MHAFQMLRPLGRSLRLQNARSTHTVPPVNSCDPFQCFREWWRLRQSNKDINDNDHLTADVVWVPLLLGLFRSFICSIRLVRCLFQPKFISFDMQCSIGIAIEKFLRFLVDRVIVFGNFAAVTSIAAVATTECIVWIENFPNFRLSNCQSQMFGNWHFWVSNK